MPSIAPKLRQAIDDYVTARETLERLMEFLGNQPIGAEDVFDELECDLIDRLDPKTLDDVRGFPARIQRSAIVDLLDRLSIDGPDGIDEGVLDWCRVQILGRDEIVERLLEDRSIHTPSEVVQWLRLRIDGDPQRPG